MKIFYFTILVFLMQSSDGAVVRQRPAFAKPVYSNSYLPAAMQVIFHAVDQLKNLEAEEVDKDISGSVTSVPVTSPHSPGQHQPTHEEIALLSTDSTTLVDTTASIDSAASTDSLAYEASTASLAYEASTASLAYEASTAATSGSSTGVTFSEASLVPTSMEPLPTSLGLGEVEPIVALTTDEVIEDKPEVSEETTSALEAETPEENYATPETNHEPEEAGEEIPEANQEVPEKIEVYREEESTSGGDEPNMAEAPTTPETKPLEREDDSSKDVDESKKNGDESKKNGDESKENGDESKENGDESKKNGDASKENGDESKENSDESKENSDESKENGDESKENSDESKEDSDESKSLGSSESEQDERQSAEEEDDEIRFTLIGEKVSQVPRPSLTSYLRKTVKTPLASSVQQLAGLYDALSKDARKQGLAKFSGYSDEVLKSLQSTMEGGVGPQLLVLLEKAVERNELTRDDTKLKISNALNELGNPASALSTDLRRLVPLRFAP